MKIMVINGPNLNLLGTRERDIYGERSYADLESYIEGFCAERGIEVVVLQSNGEGEIIDFIHHALGNYDAIVMNPGAYTHYSYAIRDAIAAVRLPVVEVHASNVYAREEFRHSSVIAPVCLAQVAGMGFIGYTAAIEFLMQEVGAKGE